MTMTKRHALRNLIVTIVTVVGLWLLMRYCLRLFWTEPYLNLKYDWGYSLFGWHNPWLGSVNAWNDWFTGSSIMVNTAWAVTVVIVVVANLTHLAATPFLALLLTTILVVASIGMAVLLHARGCRWWLAVVLGVMYAFAPMMWIRVMTGFVYYLLAAALAPWFIWLWTRAAAGTRVDGTWGIIPLLAVLISAQPQFAVMIGLVLVLDLITATKLYRRRGLKLALLTFVVLGIAHAPWLVLLFRGGAGAVSATNNLGGSLSTIESIPHSALRTLFGADHHITFNIIDQLLTHRGYALVSLGLVGLAVLAPLLARKHRTVTVMTIALAISWVMGLGPQVPTTQVFIWIYQHLPFNNIFREVYHWSWLITFSLITLAGLSLESIATRWRAIPALIIGVGLMAGWAAPWLRGDFYSYITALHLPAGYQAIALTSQQADTSPSRSLFLPSMGFLVFRDDKTPGAVNSDIYSFATNRSHLPFATSLLDFPTRAQEIRNATVMALRTQNAGPFAGYLHAVAVDTIFDRPTLKTKFTELFTLPASRHGLVNDWQDLRYAPLLNNTAGIKRVKNYEGVTQYQVNNPTPLISYASREILAGDDWKILAENGDAAVFFASDEPNRNDLPYMGDLDDRRAASLQDANILPYDAGRAVVPTDGWVGKSAVWWWDPALSTIKGPYLFTTSSTAIQKQVNLHRASYDVLAKYWVSRWAKDLTVKVGETNFTIQTADATDGSWRWERLGNITGDESSMTVGISGEGETGLAQLLIVDHGRLDSLKLTQVPLPPAQTVPTLVFAKKSPSLYSLELNSAEPQTVVARIGYDSGWRLHTKAGDLTPTLVDGYAMAFTVPATHETATLEFMPQRTYHALIIIAGFVTVLLLLAAAWLTGSQRRKP